MPAFAVPSVELDLPIEHTTFRVRGNVVSKITDQFKVFYTNEILEEITAFLVNKV